MNVSEAVDARRSVRDFEDRAVAPELLVSLAEKAARAPSGGNLQPWHIDLVQGDALAELKALVRQRLDDRVREAPEYPVYPEQLSEPYNGRRFSVGEEMYRLLDVAREDKAGRHQWFARNFEFFGAPAALFATVDRQMGHAQWSDLGMYLQTFMLLAVEAGLATCPQESWSLYPGTITGFLGTPPERMLFCGMAIGYERADHPINALRSERAPAAEWLTIR